MRSMHLRAVLVSLLLVAGLQAATTAPAQAAGRTSVPDPGFCGVRHANFQAGFQHVYQVRNQCSQGWNFAVYLPGLGRTTVDGCKWVGPGAVKEYVDTFPDQNWRVINC